MSDEPSTEEREAALVRMRKQLYWLVPLIPVLFVAASAQAIVPDWGTGNWIMWWSLGVVLPVSWILIGGAIFYQHRWKQAGPGFRLSVGWMIAWAMAATLAVVIILRSIFELGILN